MTGLIRSICITALVTGLGGCGDTARQACAPGVGAPSGVFTLFFGESIPGRGDLTDKEWQAFLDDTVTSNLPSGYTIIDAHGAWMNPTTRKTIKEATKLLLVALPETSDSLAAINRIRGSFQRTFHQQLVGMTVQEACATF